MLESIDIQPLLRMTASESFWAGFRPRPGDLAGDETAPNDRAEWLKTILDLWARAVHDRLSGWGEHDAGPDRDRELSRLLEALMNAATALLAFKRRDLPFDVPSSLLECAQLVFALAEKRQVRAGELTIQRVALRLANASSRRSKATAPTRVDEQGRTFSLAGVRLFQFDPADVLAGRRERQARRSRPADH